MIGGKTRKFFKKIVFPPTIMGTKFKSFPKPFLKVRKPFLLLMEYEAQCEYLMLF
jgi:hypothetical protein